MQDALRTLPCQDPLASSAAWQRVKAGAPYLSSCTLALAALDRAYTIAEVEVEGSSLRWEVLLGQARCRRKLQQPAASWLPLMAEACRFASEEEGGVLLPVYALHASRMRLLLGMPAAQRWAAGGKPKQHQQGVGGTGARSSRLEQQLEQASEEQAVLLQLVASSSFLPATSSRLRSLSPAALASLPAAEAEGEQQAAWLALLEDCCAAMHWCLEKDRNFHRAAFR